MNKTNKPNHQSNNTLQHEKIINTEVTTIYFDENKPANIQTDVQTAEWLNRACNLEAKRQQNKKFCQQIPQVRSAPT